MSTTYTRDHTQMIKTRFAPSPTGFLHIGGARTALFNYLFAKNKGGKFYLRIEDTDHERSTPEAVQAILDGMAWLGLDHDGEIIYQSKRIKRHKEVIQKLIDKGDAYYCYCSKEELDNMRSNQEKLGLKPKYDGTWRPEEGKQLPQVPKGIDPVVRFKNPSQGFVEWEDHVKGSIKIANEELDDLIIARSDGTPTYNLCVVVDDLDMEISHVIRGDDHINNTPRQINIYRALNVVVPEFAHLSMILGDDGQKLSKRHGSVNVTDYQDKGYLAESINNYIARLGWSHGDDEIISMRQLCEWFDLTNITSSAAQFNTEKLNWLNNHYLKTKLFDEIEQYLDINLLKKAKGNRGLVSEIYELYKDRCQTLREFETQVEFFFAEKIDFDQKLIEKHFNNETNNHLKMIKEQINSGEFQLEKIELTLKDYVKENNLKFPQIAMPLRVVLTGIDQTPSIGHIIAIIGKDKFNERIESFLNA